MSKAPEENGFKPVQNADGSVRPLAVPKFMKDPLFHLSYREDKYGFILPIHKPGVPWSDAQVQNEANEPKADTVVERSSAQDQRHITEGTVRFEEGEMALVDDSNRCELARMMKVHHLCRIMFREPGRSLVSWDQVYEEITEKEAPHKDDSAKVKRSAKKMVRDTMQRANKHFKKDFSTTQNIFVWRTNSIIRQL